MASDIDSPISPTLLELLRCPETHQTLSLAASTLLSRVTSEKLCNRAGQPVDAPLEAGLLREDGAVLYPIRDGIPIMLIDESIPLPAGFAGPMRDKPLV
jgi:uncharacterized protein YbaR (Trm112 family)